VEAVAAGHDVAAQLLGAPGGVPVDDRGTPPVDARHGDRGGLEQHLPAGREPGRHQVFDHLLLPVHRDRATGEVGERDAVVLAVEAQRQPVVRQALAVHPLPQPDLAQQLGGGVLEHPGPYPLLDVVAAARLQHHRLDAGQVQQVRQQQAGRAGPDDPHLRSGHVLSILAASCRA
jgi:hypothetical protein